MEDASYNIGNPREIADQFCAGLIPLETFARVMEQICNDMLLPSLRNPMLAKAYDVARRESKIRHADHDKTSVPLPAANDNKCVTDPAYIPVHPGNRLPPKPRHEWNPVDFIDHVVLEQSGAGSCREKLRILYSTLCNEAAASHIMSSRESEILQAQIRNRILARRYELGLE